MTRFPMTRRSFRTWLEAKPPTWVVGRTALMFECPVATALREAGFVEPNVRLHVVSLGPTETRESVLLPRWAREFIDQVDAGPPAGRPVLAMNALAILDHLL